MRNAPSKLIVAATAAAIAISSWLGGEAASAGRVVVEIEDFEYRPATPDVKPGDVIVWVNRDIVPHTVSAKDRSWDSGLITSGGSWEMVVDDDAFRTYFCKFHPSMAASLEIASE